jgi:hypothetical protein
MSTTRIRNPQTSLSAALRGVRAGVGGAAMTLRSLLAQIGEQGLLVFCAILALPFALPVTIPMMSTVFGMPMLLIAVAVTSNRMPWLPDRVLEREIPADVLTRTLDRAIELAERFEHLVRPRLLTLSGTMVAGLLNGLTLLFAVLLLMAPLPLVPFANTMPAIAIVLLCLGMAERDGVLLIAGYAVTALAAAYIGTLIWLVVTAGRNLDDAWRLLQDLPRTLFGT